MSNQKQQKSLVVTELHSISARFGEVANHHKAVTFSAECEFAKGIVEGNDYLKKVFYDNPESLKTAIMNVAGAGISLNPIKKHAYLVPRYVNKRMTVCLDVSYIGLSHLACDTGSIIFVTAELVHEKDDFQLMAINEPPKHIRDPFTERGEIVGGYCVAKLADGDYLTTTMPIAEIKGIMERSEAYKAVVAKKAKSCPWTTDFGEMAKKTVIKRGSKLWPKVDTSNRLDKAIHTINQHEGIDFKSENEIPVIEGEAYEPIDYSERDEQLEHIKTDLAILTKDMKSLDEKGAFLKTHCGVDSFKQLTVKHNDELDEIVEKLKRLISNNEQRNKACQSTSEALKNDPKDVQADIGAKSVTNESVKPEVVQEKKKEVKKEEKVTPRSAKDVSFRLD